MDSNVEARASSSLAASAGGKKVTTRDNMMLQITEVDMQASHSLSCTAR